jgi:hypothetical protein
MVGKQKPATKAEKARMSLIKEQAWCIPCILNNTPNRSATTIQHVVSGNKRTGQTYGCCGWHHLGQQADGWARFDMMHLLGPALPFGSKEYQEVWAEEGILVQLQDKLIEMWENSPWEQYNLPRHVGYEIRKLCGELKGMR